MRPAPAYGLSAHRVRFPAAIALDRSVQSTAMEGEVHAVPCPHTVMRILVADWTDFQEGTLRVPLVSVLLRLIGKWLNAVVLEGLVLSCPDEGAPQRG